MKSFALSLLYAYKVKKSFKVKKSAYSWSLRYAWKRNFMSKIDPKLQNVCPNFFIESRARKIIFTIPKSGLQQENFGGLFFGTNLVTMSENFKPEKFKFSNLWFWQLTTCQTIVSWIQKSLLFNSHMKRVFGLSVFSSPLYYSTILFVV